VKKKHVLFLTPDKIMLAAISCFFICYKVNHQARQTTRKSSDKLVGR